MKKSLFLLLFFISTLFANEPFQTSNTLVANGKGVMFIFESNTCPYCDLLKKDFKENEKMKALAKEFNIYLINQENEQEYIVGEKKKKETTTTLRMAFAAKATPNIVIFDKHWNRIFQIPGYASPSQMVTFMNFVKGLHEGKYDTKDWQKYLKENGVS
jgi:thioredoxin-related protein